MPCTFEGCERNIRSRSACLDELTPDQVLDSRRSSARLTAPSVHFKLVTKPRDACLE